MLFRVLIAVALLAGVASPTHAQTKIKTVATFSILADLLREVGGDRVEVATLVGPDTDAHTYQPKPTDARTLAAARVLLSNGLGFEGWIDRLAEAAAFKGTHIVATAGLKGGEWVALNLSSSVSDGAQVQPVEPKAQ